VLEFCFLIVYHTRSLQLACFFLQVHVLKLLWNYYTTLILSSTASKFIIGGLYFLLIRKPVPEILLLLPLYISMKFPASNTPLSRHCISWIAAISVLYFYTSVCLFTTIIQPASIIRLLNDKIILQRWGCQPHAWPGYPFLSGSSPLTCPAWEALPVA